MRRGNQLSLIQMATGSEKTFTTVNFSYRLVKHAKAKRILFLVDRKTLEYKLKMSLPNSNCPAMEGNSQMFM